MASLNIGTITNVFSRLHRNQRDPESNPLVTVTPKHASENEQGYIKLLKNGSGK